MLEIIWEEMSIDKYTEEFRQSMLVRCHIELTDAQIELLSQSIEQARLNGYAPVDLAIELAEIYEEFF